MTYKEFIKEWQNFDINEAHIPDDELCPSKEEFETYKNNVNPCLYYKIIKYALAERNYRINLTARNNRVNLMTRSHQVNLEECFKVYGWIDNKMYGWLRERDDHCCTPDDEETWSIDEILKGDDPMAKAFKKRTNRLSNSVNGKIIDNFILNGKAI